MTPEEEHVRAATHRFYEAIEQVITGKGLAAMRDAWHHDVPVSSAHPMGDWAHGWDEVFATWGVFASLGNEALAGSTIRDLRVHVHGDVAHTTCVFVGSPTLGSPTLNCTNVLRRVQGVWKIVHHHPDKDAGVAAALEGMAAGG
jgi:ketosteroid isomerase-like protein